MNSKINILDVLVDNITMEEAVRKISEFTNVESYHMVFTPNPEIIMLAQINDSFKEALNKADLVVPDGIGVVIASKMLKGAILKERVPGYDLVQNTMKEAVQNDYRYYFLGGKPGIAELAAEKMKVKYPGIQIVGTHHGYFKKEDEKDIIDKINKSGANILLVALGAPKQELWIEEYKQDLQHVRVAIGVGGSFDVMAEAVKRAPVFFQKCGLEWFYRLIKQPSRAKRMLLIPKFIVKVARQRKDNMK